MMVFPQNNSNLLLLEMTFFLFVFFGGVVACPGINSSSKFIKIHKMSLFSWLNCVTMYVRPCSIGDIVGQYVTVSLANMSLFAWPICHCLLCQYVSVCLAKYVTVYLAHMSLFLGQTICPSTSMN